MVDVDQWYQQGYLDKDIWSHLQSYVKADALHVSVSDVTVTSGNTVVTASCSFSGNKGTLMNLLILFPTLKQILQYSFLTIK